MGSNSKQKNGPWGLLKRGSVQISTSALLRVPQLLSCRVQIDSNGGHTLIKPCMHIKRGSS